MLGQPTDRKPFLLAVLVSLVLIAALGVLSMLFGAGNLTVSQAWGYLLGDATMRADEQLSMVMQSLRFPRLVAAILVGASLGVAGALLQTVTRNPLADTELLGINSGAALGVVIGITLLGAQTALAYLLWALLGTAVGTTLILAIANFSRSGVTPLQLILAGIGLRFTFFGLASMILLRNQTSYDEYRFWVLGSLAGVDLGATLKLAGVMLLGFAIALLLVKPLQALALGDDLAKSLGHRPAVTRTGATLAVTLLTGTGVALTGPIAFLALVSPHLARSIAGHRIGQLIVLSALAGALLLLGADVLCRVVMKPYETPASLMIALVGAPMLVWIVQTNRMLTIRHMETR